MKRAFDAQPNVHFPCRQDTEYADPACARGIYLPLSCAHKQGLARTQAAQNVELSMIPNDTTTNTLKRHIQLQHPQPFILVNPSAFVVLNCGHVE